jgi:hypothetical protein
MWPLPIKLLDLLTQARCNRPPEGWLYLPKDWRGWSAETEADMLNLDGDDDDQLDAEAAARGYICTIDSQMLVDVLRAVRDHLNADSFDVWLEALIYYQRFDAFVPSIGAPDPPPWEETQRTHDRAFYDSLGAERPTERCREPRCQRGAVKQSVLCRVHHFQQVQKRPCPLND